jgi:polysaccharide biosynthesis protein PslG
MRVPGTIGRHHLAGLGVVVAAVLALATAASSAGGHTPAPPHFYGVAASTALQQEDFNRLARANIRTVRITFYWPAIETGNGRYNWLNVDGSVMRASAAGVTLIPTFIGSPQRVSDNPLRPPLDSPSEQEQWQHFVSAAVDRYGRGGEFWDFVRQCDPLPGFCRPNHPYRPLTVWQAWNEPNLGIFWQPSPSPGEYGRLLELTNEAVKREDPGAELITGGIMPGGLGTKNAIGQNDFLAALYQQGAADNFDGIDLHPYQRKPKHVRGLVEDARALSQAYGDGGTPLWVTEVGWSTKGSKKDEQVTSRKGQAKRLTKTMKMLTAMRGAYGIRLASWFTYEDAEFEDYCDWCPGAGLLDKKEKPKPAWRRYLRITGGQG